MQFAVIDDHPMLLDAVTQAIESMGGDYRAVGHSTLEAFDDAVAAGARFDLVLLDLELPPYTGLASLEYFQSWHDDMPVVVLSATRDAETILKALDLNAMGYITKNSPREVLQGAIRLVLSGGCYVPPEVVRAMGVAVGVASPPPAVPADPPAEGTKGKILYGEESVPALAGLTPRERDVLGLLLKGMSNKLICRELNLSPNTIKSHVAAIFGALGVHSRAQVVIAVQPMLLRVNLRRSDAPDLRR